MKKGKLVVFLFAALIVAYSAAVNAKDTNQPAGDRQSLHGLGTGCLTPVFKMPVQIPPALLGSLCNLPLAPGIQGIVVSTGFDFHIVVDIHNRTILQKQEQKQKQQNTATEETTNILQ